MIISSIQAYLYAVCEDESEVISLLERNPLTAAVLPFDPDAMERKLRRAIDQMPHYLDPYMALTTLLVKMGKIAEARTVAEKGIKLERRSKWDISMGKMLEMARDSIAEL